MVYVKVSFRIVLKKKKVLGSQWCLTLCNRMDCRGSSARLLCSWDFAGKNTGVGCHSLLQGIFLTQGLNPHLLHCRQILYHLEPPGKPFHIADACKHDRLIVFLCLYNVYVIHYYVY